MISGIHISSSEMVINNDNSKKNAPLKLTKNQVILAKVLSVLPQGNAELMVNGQKVVAKTGLLLKPGEEVNLKVIQEKDAVILRLIGPAQKMTTRQISSLVGFFSRNELTMDIAGARMTHVKSLLYDMALKSDKPDKAFLPKLLEKSGILWEKNVAKIILSNNSTTDIKAGLDLLLGQDVKGNILKEMLIADPQKLEMLKTATSFLDTIENFQLLNHSSSESGRFILPFPIFSESAFSFGQLLIDTGDKTNKDKKESDKLIKISFMLDMTRLGPLRADFSILKKEISGRFLLMDEDTCNYVKSMIFELKKGLEKIGYNIHQIDCSVAKKEDIQKNSFIETLVKECDDQVLNIVI